MGELSDNFLWKSEESIRRGSVAVLPVLEDSDSDGDPIDGQEQGQGQGQLVPVGGPTVAQGEGDEQSTEGQNEEKEITYPDKHAKRIYSFEEIEDGAHIARHTALWYDEFSHVLVASVEQDLFSYYECVPLHNLSNVAQVFYRVDIVDEQYKIDFFSRPVFLLEKPNYTYSVQESIYKAAEMHEKSELQPCDGVFSFWKFYTSEAFVLQCKMGKNRTKRLGLKHLIAHPMKSIRRSDRYELERDLGYREDSYNKEATNTATAGARAGVTRGPAGQLATRTVVKMGAKSGVVTNARSIVARKTAASASSTTARNTSSASGSGAHASSSSKSAGSSSTTTSAGATAVSAAAIAVPIALAETAVDIHSRWKNIEGLVTDGLIEDHDLVGFYRKKYAAMYVTGNSVNCGCIVAGAVVGSMIPIPVAGVLIGAVGGAVVGAVGGIGAKRIVGATADHLYNKQIAFYEETELHDNKNRIKEVEEDDEDDGGNGSQSDSEDSGCETDSVFQSQQSISDIFPLTYANKFNMITSPSPPRSPIKSTDSTKPAVAL